MSMSMAIHLDLSEIIATPIRTGIQRIEREAIRHWPGPAPLVPVCVDGNGQLLRLPDGVLDMLCEADSGSLAVRETERSALQVFLASGKVLESGEVQRLLNLELFFNPIRADAHLRLAANGVRVLWYVYDFLPFLRPDLFESGTTRHCMHFLRALRGVTAVAFLSQATREDYVKRIARKTGNGSGQPVLSPGADGLGLEPQVFSAARRLFVSIGTLEPRKNPLSLLRAFEVLWSRGIDAPLVLAGRLSPAALEEHAFIARHASDRRLTVMEEPSDAALRAVLREARAVVMASEAEGFGLPPYEAVYAGIPAIVSASLPSAALIPAGTMMLAHMTPDAIAAAVERLLDDATAERLWAAAAKVRLPTWSDFGRNLGAWAHAA